MRRSLLRTGFSAILTIAGITQLFAAKNDLESKIRALVANGTVVLNDENGAPLLSIEADRLFVPASIIKVLTSQIALDILGPEYRFRTDCHIDNDAGNLIIKGYGDPYFVSDEIRRFAKALKGAGITGARRLYLDHSYFTDDLAIPGISTTSNPYDALNGALVVNFNTINVKKDAAGNVESAEAETPLTPLALEKARDIAQGGAQRVNLSGRREDCRRYAHELILRLLREQGVSISDTVTVETAVAPGRPPALSYANSKPLTEVLRGLLKYSNNFIANQIFLEIGARENGAPATMAKGSSVFVGYIRTKLNIPESELVMVEGSGISRDNRVTGRVMAAIMERFKPHAGLLTPKNGHPLKSGTLTGVSNYAGYIKTAKGLRSFVIILNQEKNNRDAILKLLEQAP